MHAPKLLFAVFAMTVQLASMAEQVVIDGGRTNGHSAFFSDDASPTAAAATRVLLAEAVTFNQLDWWGGYFNSGSPSSSESFELSLFEGSGTTPGSLMVTMNLGSGSPVSLSTAIGTTSATIEYAYSSSFEDVSLQPGSYFWALRRIEGEDTSTWGWSTTSLGQQLGGASFISIPGFFSRWNPRADANMAFVASYVSAVPNPSAFWLLSVGFPVIGLARHRARPARQV